MIQINHTALVKSFNQLWLSYTYRGLLLYDKLCSLTCPRGEVFLINPKFRLLMTYLPISVRHIRFYKVLVICDYQV